MQLFLKTGILKYLAIYPKDTNKTILNQTFSTSYLLPRSLNCNFTQGKIIFERKKKTSVQIFFTHPLGIAASLFSWDGSKS